jgi:hypothetical protein
MLKSAFTFTDKVPECYIHVTVIRVAKIGVKCYRTGKGYRKCYRKTKKAYKNPCKPLIILEPAMGFEPATC